MLISLVRTVILYILILASLRLMGKRQIGDLTTGELVVTLLISDIASLPMQDTSQPLVSGLIPILCLVAFELLLSFSMLKSEKIRRLVCGKPVVIIEAGRVLPERLRALRMTPEDLFEELRQKGIDSLKEVAWAVVETNGKLSVLQKAASKPLETGLLRPELLQSAPQESELEVVVIRDGCFSDLSIALCGKSRAWLREQLAAQGIASEKEVFLMTATQRGRTAVVRKESSK